MKVAVTPIMKHLKQFPKTEEQEIIERIKIVQTKTQLRLARYLEEFRGVKKTWSHLDCFETHQLKQMSEHTTNKPIYC